MPYSQATWTGGSSQRADTGPAHGTTWLGWSLAPTAQMGYDCHILGGDTMRRAGPSLLRETWALTVAVSDPLPVAPVAGMGESSWDYRENESPTPLP